MKKLRWLVSAGMVLVLLITVVQLVLAAFSNTIRRIGSNSEFSNVSVVGGMTLGSSLTDGSIRLKTSTSPPTCNSGSEGTLYANTTDHIVYLCNGTSWSSI